MKIEKVEKHKNCYQPQVPLPKESVKYKNVHKKSANNPSMGLTLAWAFIFVTSVGSQGHLYLRLPEK